jgi:hypothetical protein
MRWKMKLIYPAVLAIFLSGSMSWADCSLGSMTKVVEPIQLGQVTLNRGTEVHLVSATKDHLEFYAMKDGTGEYVHRMGQVSIEGPAMLACQKN